MGVFGFWKRRHGKSVEDWLNEGIVCFSKREYEKGLILVDKALKIDPLCVNAWFAKGTILESLGKYEEAVEDFEKPPK